MLRRIDEYEKGGTKTYTFEELVAHARELANQKTRGQETEFEQELLRRFDDYENGKIVPLTIDELEAKVRTAHAK
jgi:hypothetical protein